MVSSKIKLVVLAVLWIGVSFAASSSNYLNDYQAYQDKDKNKIAVLAQNNPTDLVANYLYALNNVNESNNTTVVIKYIKQDSKSPLAISLAHKTLTENYTSQNWSNYLEIYNLIESTQFSQNEICGQYLAQYATTQQIPDKSVIANLIKNKMPDRCVSLIATLGVNNQLDGKYLIPALYSMIINNQISQYNQVASANNIPNYQLNDTKVINKYDVVYKISQLAKSSPDVALTTLNQINIDKFTKQYLYNYVATRLAIKQMFDLALIATKQGHNTYLSDDQYEWKARIYLANQKWSDVKQTINNMPDNLKFSDKWKYWRAYADNKLGNSKQANQILKTISFRPSFYSLLANSELGNSYTIPAKAKSINVSNLQYADYTKLGFDLYTLGDQNNISLYKNLGTYVLYRTIGYSNDIEKTAISDRAYTLNINDVGVYAAIKMNNIDINRAFPLLYLDSYTQSSQENSIPVTVPLAITRQESRFNAKALAFDGGVGLMQLMPATSAHIAKNLHLSTDCYKTSYQCNIREGTWFIANLYNKFGSNLIYASSGYNAGPGRANRWEKAFYGMDNQLQTELIPFDITRTYAQNILTNQLIYDGLLNNKPLNMSKYLRNINNKDTTFIDDDNNIGNDNTDENTSLGDTNKNDSN